MPKKSAIDTLMGLILNLSIEFGTRFLPTPQLNDLNLCKNCYKNDAE